MPTSKSMSSVRDLIEKVSGGRQGGTGSREGGLRAAGGVREAGQQGSEHAAASQQQKQQQSQEQGQEDIYDAEDEGFYACKVRPVWAL